MSAFGSIAVLKQPTFESRDWSFQMGDLQFDIHNDMIELHDELVEFDKFTSSVAALTALLDYIDNNNSRVEKVVFDLVNQNNELAQALGIVVPYSFATEAEEAAAASDVKEAAEGSDEDDDRGFFARAWDAIKKFFGKIRDMVTGIWKKMTGQKSENLAQMAKENTAAAQQIPDNEFAKFKFEGLASPSTLQGIVNACAAMVQNVSKLPTEPGQFYTQICKNYGSAFEALGVTQYLDKLGISAVKGNDGTYTISNRKNNYTADNDSVTEQWDKNTTIKSQEWTIKFIELKRKLSEQADAFTKMLDSLQADKSRLEKLAADMASETYEKRPYLQKKAWWHFKYNRDVDAQNAEIRKENKAANDLKRRQGANKESQAQVAASMSFGQEVAALNQFILKLVNIFESEVTAIVSGIHKVIVERKKAADDWKQQNLEARAKLGDQYQAQINRQDDRTEAEKMLMPLQMTRTIRHLVVENNYVRF